MIYPSRSIIDSEFFFKFSNLPVQIDHYFINSSFTTIILLGSSLTLLFAIYFPLPHISFLLFLANAIFSSVQLLSQLKESVSDSLRPHESQHARPPCPSPTPGVHSNSWCNLTLVQNSKPSSFLPRKPSAVFSPLASSSLNSCSICSVLHAFIYSLSLFFFFFAFHHLCLQTSDSKLLRTEFLVLLLGFGTWPWHRLCAQ